MPIVICECNAGTERSFQTRTAAGETNLSKSKIFSVFFDLIHPGKPTEKRQLRVVEKKTGKVIEIPLNDDGGAKPANGEITPHLPHVRPILRKSVSIDTDQERLFFTDVNLSADAAIDIQFKIDPDGETKDKRRFLTFNSTKPGFPQALQGSEINLSRSAAKKPLEGGFGLNAPRRRNPTRTPV